MQKTGSQPDALLGWMEGLSDPTRLRLLRLLERHELGVVELCDILQLPQSTVSRHLKILLDQGWARSRRQGTTHLYRTILDELEAPTRKLWLIAREQTENWPAIEQDRLRLDRRLQQRQQDSQAFFASAAGQWDKLRSELYGQFFTYSAMLELLPRNLAVADLGCGTGQITQRLADHVQQVIAIDNSPAMLKAAKKRLGERPNVDLRRGELQALPLDDAAVDAALLVLVLSYVDSIEPVLKEARRVLKPGGTLVVVDLLPHDRDDFRRQMGQVHLGFSQETLTTALATAGLAQAVTRPIPTERDAKGPALQVARASAH
jgi:ubiquinone/menaquinone biosynthesis C-methylase UbiE/DNA-binding transcriptional ArsR family regulator